MKLHCMNCGKETELNKIYNDDLGYHRVCPECGASHDIDDETAFEFEKQLYERRLRYENDKENCKRNCGRYGVAFWF